MLVIEARDGPRAGQALPSISTTHNDSWRIDETYVKVKGVWKYLYRAVDSEGNTLDFLLSAKRDAKAAKRFLKKVLSSPHTQFPRVIAVDKNAVYPPVIDELKADESLSKTTETRQVQYLNNLVEQDHRFIKRRIKPGLGFGSFINTTRRALKGYEAMNMIRKDQIKDIEGEMSYTKSSRMSIICTFVKPLNHMT